MGADGDGDPQADSSATPLVDPAGDAPPAARHAKPSRPEARLSPQALAGRRRDTREGLAWLGRAPEVRASLLFRVIRLFARFVLFGIFRFRVTATGREHIPRGGYLLVGAAHRGWMDPFLVLHALPSEPRAWFLGSAASAFDRRWKEWLLHRLGGMLPVWRGGVNVDQHVASAGAVLRAGGVFVLFPEGGVAGPPDDIAAFRVGAALIALRTDAPILPFVMAGSQELYRGRRMATKILAPTSARQLLGETADATRPAPGTRAELVLARRLTEALENLLRPEVRALAATVQEPAGRRHRWRGLTWLLLRRPAGRR